MAEKSEKGPCVVIWDLIKMLKRKVLLFPEAQTQVFSYISFSSDSKYLLIQGGSPEWTLGLWLWEKGKLVSELIIYVHTRTLTTFIS